MHTRASLLGKTALVTGASEGIGFAIVKAFAAAGARVVLASESKPGLDHALMQLSHTLPDAKVEAVQADLSQADGCATVTRLVPRADVLVNNVGKYGYTDFFTSGDDVWQQYFDLNVMSGIRLSRHYLPGMMQAKWGRILFISSTAALTAGPTVLPYSFSKMAQLSVSRGLAEIAAGTGVTVNALLPGPVRTEGLALLISSGAEAAGMPVSEYEPVFLQQLTATSLVKRVSEPEEIADYALFLCSELGASVSGSPVRVDGGMFHGVA